MAENPPDTDVTEPDPQNEAGVPPDISAEQGSSLDTDRWRKPEIDPESKIPVTKKIKLFCGTHYLGIVTYFTPIIFLAVLHPFPPEKWQWCAYCLCVMATYWVFECIPLPVTAFIPVIIFPLSDIMSTRRTCQCYMNNTVMMFLGSIMLAASVEQSGLHRRIALYAIKCIGYSHKRMLLAVSLVTMFISMWITNTAATTMMVPILFALLKVYEDQRLYKIYEENASGEKIASRITGCYFCCITYAATIGGLGTLVGTATNLVFHGLFMEPGWSLNPFWEDELADSSRTIDESNCSVQPTPSTSKKVTEKKPAKKRAPKKPKAQSASQVKELSALDSCSESEDDVISCTQSPPVKRKRPEQVLESEHEVRQDKFQKPVRAAALKSFLTQRGASGFTTQRDPTKTGEYFIELRVYNSSETERLPAEDRWKNALTTLKTATDVNTPLWAAVSKLVQAGKQDFIKIQPIMYPSGSQ